VFQSKTGISNEKGKDDGPEICSIPLVSDSIPQTSTNTTIAHDNILAPLTQEQKAKLQQTIESEEFVFKETPFWMWLESNNDLRKMIEQQSWYNSVQISSYLGFVGQLFGCLGLPTYFHALLMGKKSTNKKANLTAMKSNIQQHIQKGSGLILIPVNEGGKIGFF